MSEHLHAEHVDGCFRCELSRDEERQYEQYTPTTVQVLDAAVQTGFYSYAEVNRWHQAELRRAKAEALRGAADELRSYITTTRESPYLSAGKDIIRRIDAQADEIERTINDHP